MKGPYLTAVVGSIVFVGMSCPLFHQTDRPPAPRVHTWAVFNSVFRSLLQLSLSSGSVQEGHGTLTRKRSMVQDQYGPAGIRKKEGHGFMWPFCCGLRSMSRAERPVVGHVV